LVTLGGLQKEMKERKESTKEKKESKEKSKQILCIYLDIPT
jgi:hypothetical protein